MSNGFDPAIAAAQSQPVRAPVSASDLDIFFTVALRHPLFFTRAARKLYSHHFDEAAEPHFRLLWHVMCAVYAEHNLFSTDLLLNAIHNALQAGHIILTHEDYDDLVRQDAHGLVWGPLRTPTPEVEALVLRAEQIRDNLLFERTVSNPLRQFMNQSPRGAIDSLPEFMSNLGDHMAGLNTLNTPPCDSVAVSRGTVLEAARELRPTGIDLIDDVLGGQGVGDVAGLIGATGAGKTTLGIQLAVNSARVSVPNAIAAAAPGTIAVLPWSLFFSYEEPTARMRPRVWSCAYEIPLLKCSTLDGATWKDLTTQATLADYERTLCGNGEPLSERDRWDSRQGWLDTAFKLYDMSGSGNHAGVGVGGVAEISSWVEQLQQDTQRPIYTVVIDYASLVCRRQMAAQGADEGVLRHRLQAFGDECKRMIAEKFNCAVWVLHQLSGQATSKGPYHLMHHYDSSDAKLFAENMAVCGCMGPADKATGCRRLNWSKTRHVADGSSPPLLLQHHQQFAQMIDASGRYSVDERLRKIITKQEADAVMGMSEVRGGHQAGPTGLTVETTDNTMRLEPDSEGDFLSNRRM